MQPWPLYNLLGQAARGCSAAWRSGWNSSRSPGWQASTSQIASSVEKRIARALPVLRIDRLASVMSTFSASSVSVIRRSWSRSSSLTAIAMSHRPFEVFAHQSAFGEDARKDEHQDHGQPAAGRETGVEVDRMLTGRDHLADGADHQAQQLEREQQPGDRIEAVS